jgi:subfamily B ATP-binding cassette protein MsbA
MARLHTPDSDQITAYGEFITEFPLDESRERVAVLRHSPFIFNETLRYDGMIINRSTSQAEIERGCNSPKSRSFSTSCRSDSTQCWATMVSGCRAGSTSAYRFARALLTGAVVLVSDEATSDLDSGI